MKILKITLLQEFESHSDTSWKNNCQYFKVGGVRFPTCTMINDNEFILSVDDRKSNAYDEVNTILLSVFLL